MKLTYIIQNTREWINENGFETFIGCVCAWIIAGGVYDIVHTKTTPINETQRVVRIWNPKTREARRVSANQGIVECLGETGQNHLVYLGSNFDNPAKSVYENRSDTVLTHDKSIDSPITKVIGKGGYIDVYTLHLPREDNVK